MYICESFRYPRGYYNIVKGEDIIFMYFHANGYKCECANVSINYIERIIFSKLKYLSQEFSTWRNRSNGRTFQETFSYYIALLP